MTLIEFARAYGERFADNGASWMQKHVENLIESGLTEESLEEDRIKFHRLTMGSDDPVERGLYWSTRDRLAAIQQGWAIFRDTGKNILKK